MPRGAREFEIPQPGPAPRRCELDAIDIAAPREMHAPLVRLAAAKRLPVLCQKPLAPNLQEATDLAAEVEGS
jgi:predicted dehydrogenase